VTAIGTEFGTLKFRDCIKFKEQTELYIVAPKRVTPEENPVALL
jgi:hypothetical protein